MRNVFLLFLFITAYIQAHCEGYAKLHGNILHPDSRIVSLTYCTSSFEKNLSSMGLQIFKTGSFGPVTIPVKGKYALVLVEHDTNYTEIVVGPGADLEMHVDNNRFKQTVYYTGKGAEIANFVARHSLQMGLLEYYARQTGYRISNKTTEEYIRSLNENEMKENEFIKANGKGLPASFIEYWKTYIKYGKYVNLLNYPENHAKKLNHNKSTTRIAEESYSVVDSVPLLFNDEYISMEPYQKYILNYNVVKAKAKDLRKSEGATKICKVEYTEMPPESFAFCMSRSVEMIVADSPLVMAQTKLDEFKAMFKDNENISLFDMMLNSRKRLSKGMPAFDFDIKTPDGIKMKFSDLKGMVVYLCVLDGNEHEIHEKQSSEVKEIYNRFKDKQIAFVFVSGFVNTDEWKKFVLGHKLPGIHTQDDQEYSILNFYGYHSFPNCFLIDKNGNFATENAPGFDRKQELEAAIEAVLN